jgi:hypothetical protein
MNEAKVKAQRRQLRKALGPQAVDILSDLEARVLELERHVLPLPIWRRVWRFLTGRG